MYVFVHAQGIKIVHAGGVRKWQNSVHVVVEWLLIEEKLSELDIPKNKVLTTI